MRNKIPAGVLSLLTLLLLFSAGGCMKQGLPIYYYSLGNSDQPAVRPTDSLPPILVGPIHLASFLDQGQIVTRNSAYSVNIEEQHRWAGDLPKMLSSVIITNLRLTLGTEKIYNFSGSQESGGLQVTIDFLHFEKDSDGNGLVMARWKILSEDGGTIIHSATSTCQINPEAEGFEPLSEALSHGLAELSKEIADTIIMLTSR
jgi:uncharacterized lipoprotein YmbA